MNLLKRRNGMDASGGARRRVRDGRALLGAWLAAVLVAVCAPASADEGEPRVARVSFAEGEVSYLNADAKEWAPVEVNAPLVTGDRFYSGQNGKAEIQLPYGLYARLASETELDLLEVSSSAVHARVGVGSAIFRLRDVPARRHLEVSTPATAIVMRSRGVYRVDVDLNGQTTVLVREGEVDAYCGDERYRLPARRGAEFLQVASSASSDGCSDEGVRFFDAADYQVDQWDEWDVARTRRIDGAESYRYVSSDVYGVEDLDEYGTWSQHAEYGPVWRPTSVAAGWSPYTSGRWVWQDPWGWSWVDYAPWGWAPSHYGRWVYVNSAWGWAPGPIVSSPVYAPATVGFLGVSVNTPGFSFSVGVGGPSVGWVPLGYGEPIIPWWGGVAGVRIGQPWWGSWGGPRIINKTIINETNITNVNVDNIRYANLGYPDAVTAVSRRSFINGDFERLDLPADRLGEVVRPVRGAPEVIAERESLFATRPERLRGRQAVRPSDEVLQRAAVTTRSLPGARPSFDEKRQLIERERGAPVPPDELRRVAGNRSPAVETVAASGRRQITPDVTARTAGEPGDRSGRQALTSRGRGLDSAAESVASDAPRGRQSLGSTERSTEGRPLRADEERNAAERGRSRSPAGDERAAVSSGPSSDRQEGSSEASRGRGRSSLERPSSRSMGDRATEATGQRQESARSSRDEISRSGDREPATSSEASRGRGRSSLERSSSRSAGDRATEATGQRQESARSSRDGISRSGDRGPARSSEPSRGRERSSLERSSQSREGDRAKASTVTGSSRDRSAPEARAAQERRSSSARAQREVTQPRSPRERREKVESPRRDASSSRLQRETRSSSREERVQREPSRRSEAARQPQTEERRSSRSQIGRSSGSAQQGARSSEVSRTSRSSQASRQDGRRASTEVTRSSREQRAQPSQERRKSTRRSDGKEEGASKTSKGKR